MTTVSQRGETQGSEVLLPGVGSRVGGSTPRSPRGRILQALQPAVHLPPGDLGQEVAREVARGAGASESLAPSRIAAVGGSVVSRVVDTRDPDCDLPRERPASPPRRTFRRLRAPSSSLPERSVALRRPYSPPPPRGQLPPEPLAPRIHFLIPPPKLPVLPEACRRRCGVRMFQESFRGGSSGEHAQDSWRLRNGLEK